MRARVDVRRRKERTKETPSSLSLSSSLSSSRFFLCQIGVHKSFVSKVDVWYHMFDFFVQFLAKKGPPNNS